MAAASNAPASAAAPSAGAPSAAASAAAPSAAAAEPVTIDWWHIATGDPGKADFKAIADAYTAAHPNVKINITVTENEAFKTKLAATPADAYPDLFQSWGGATMGAQADAGLLQDITAAVAPWKDTVNAGAMSIYQYKGVQYGIPWDMGMIGFWYNKDLFQKAGITTPPATWDEYLAAIPKLKALGVAPLAIAGKDKWPSMHLWTYLVLRSGGGDALAKMIQTGDWNTDACINAGKAVLALNALDPYQKGYASADYNSEAASVGNGKAAMELMGQWAPSVQKDQSIGKVGLGDKLGWFAFPTLAGGAGAATDGVGGGNGYRRGQERAARGDRLPEVLHGQDRTRTSSTPTASASRRPSARRAPSLTRTCRPSSPVAARRRSCSYYLDQATAGPLAAAFNDATIALFLGKSTPEKVCQTLTDAAATQ